jgi:hypothetical protein
VFREHRSDLGSFLFRILYPTRFAKNITKKVEYFRSYERKPFPATLLAK